MTRLRRTLSPLGSAKRQWLGWQEQNRRSVTIRSGGACEGCGKSGRPLEWAHLAFRNHVVPEPWASLDCLTVALCVAYDEDAPGCHRRVDRHLDEDLADRLRWQAVDRLCERYGDSLAEAFGMPAEEWARRMFDRPRYALDQLVDRLEEVGWYWSETARDIVRDGRAA